TDNEGFLVLQRDFNITFRINGFMECGAVVIEIAYKRTQAAFKEKGRFSGNRANAFIAQGDGNFARDEGHLTKAFFERIKVELVFLHDGEVWHKGLYCACAFTGFEWAHLAYFRRWLAGGVGLLPHVAIAVDLRAKVR